MSALQQGGAFDPLWHTLNVPVLWVGCWLHLVCVCTDIVEGVCVCTDTVEGVWVCTDTVEGVWVCTDTVEGVWVCTDTVEGVWVLWGVLGMASVTLCVVRVGRC